MHSRHPITAQLTSLQDFMQAVKVKRTLHAAAMEPAQVFWHYLMGVMTDKAVIEWCKVFGLRDDDIHWTQVVPEGQREDVRERMYAAVGVDAEGWKKYHGEMLTYRNQCAAHHDLDAKAENFPSFDFAVAAAQFMYAELYSLNDGETGHPADLPAWADAVGTSMARIIQAAFAGSAGLGEVR